MTEPFHSRIKKLTQITGVDVSGKAKTFEEESSVTILPNNVPCFSFFTNFQEGDDGWQSGFSDYPYGEENWYELNSERTNLPYPLDFNRISLKQSAKNINSDLFMFVFKKFSGFEPYGTYEIELRMEVATNLDLLTLQDEQSYGNNAFIKAGAVNFEPATHNINLRYEVNFDKGLNQNSGNDLKILDNLTNGLLVPQFSLVKYSNTQRFRLMANADGELWVIAGVETTINNKIEVFYNKIACLIFCPENQIPKPTPSPSPTETLLYTSTPTPTPSFTPSPSPTLTSTGPTPTLTETPTLTPTETLTPTPTETPTETPLPTPTPTLTETPTLTPTETLTPTPTETPTETPLPTPTIVYGISPNPGTDFGEDAHSQVSITVLDPAFGDTIYVTDDSYDLSSTTYYIMLVYVNGVPRSAISYTEERTGSSFGYSTTGTSPETYGTFCGDLCEVYLTIP